MAIYHYAHDVQRIERTPPKAITLESGATVYTAMLRVTTGGGAEFLLDLYAPTREALRVMQNEFDTARPIDEVTR